jgi:type I restriction enzyme M protein
MTEAELIRLVKSASNKMRADDNTKGTPKYLEHFSWLLFLKVHESVEEERELLAAVDGRGYERVVGGDYRWSQWTTRGLTGDDLVTFITGDLFPHLKGLAGTPEAEKVSEVLRGITTVMKSGYVLAEVIEIINEVDFRGADDYHAMSVIYESLLAQMGADAGWSGEYYTPRPIVEFMTDVVEPTLEESVYDPCAGSCGFLVAAFERARSLASTVSDQQRLECCLCTGRRLGSSRFCWEL